MQTSDRFSGLEVFVHAAQSKSFAGTARVMNITSSAVSKAISRLEKRLGVRLFQRSTRSLQLTAEGEVFLDGCQKIFGELQIAEDTLSEISKVPKGGLKIGVPHAAGFFLPMLSAFARAYPQIALDLHFSDRVVDVIDEGFDVLIRGGGMQDSRLMSRRLTDSRIRMVAAPDYLRAHGTPTTPAELAGHSCLHYRYISSGKLAHWPLRDPTNDSDVAFLPSAMVCNSLDALLRMAEDGHGIACAPEFSVRDAVLAGRLNYLMPSHLTSTFTFFAVWPSSRQLSPRIRLFIDFISESLELRRVL